MLKSLPMIKPRDGKHKETALDLIIQIFWIICLWTTDPGKKREHRLIVEVKAEQMVRLLNRVHPFGLTCLRWLPGATNVVSNTRTTKLHRYYLMPSQPRE